MNSSRGESEIIVNERINAWLQSPQQSITVHLRYYNNLLVVHFDTLRRLWVENKNIIEMSYETSSAISKPSIKRTRDNADVIEVSAILVSHL